MSEDSGQQGETWDAKQLHDLLLDTPTIDGFLAELARGAAQATGRQCGITARGESGPYTVASSDPRVDLLDELQYANGQGPCLEALRTGLSVLAEDMATETRWGAYPQQATRNGVTSVLSYPLEGRTRTLGALNLYSFDAHYVDVDQLAVAARFAGQTAGALELALRITDQIGLVDNLQAALTSRSTIDQAIGSLMTQQRCDATTAFALLRKTSQSRNLKVRDVAAMIVAGLEHAAGRQDGPVRTA